MVDQPGGNLYTVAFGTRPENVEIPHLDVRNPSSSDIQYPIGKRWVNTAGLESWTLASLSSAGGVLSAEWIQDSSGNVALDFLIGDNGLVVPPSPTTNAITLSGTDVTSDLFFRGVPGSNELLVTNLTKDTPYVVNPTPGVAAFQTIQSAIDAASAAGGGTVFVQPDVYTENLSMASNVVVIGGYNDPSGIETVINGVHLPPSGGVTGFQNLSLVSATDIFFSAGAGSAIIFINYCNLSVGGSYVYNLANWSSTNLYLTGCTGQNSADNSVINNSGSGVNFYLDDCNFATALTGATFSGNLFLTNSSLTNSWAFTNGAVVSFSSSSNAAPLVFNDTSGGTISNSSISSGAATAITQNSTSPVSVNDSVLNSSNASAVDGGGAGGVSLSNITFPSSHGIGAGVVSGTLGVGYSDAGFISKTPFGSFFAYQGASAANATGNGASYVIGSTVPLTEVFDFGSNLGAGGVYTAPFAGVYQFSGAVAITNTTVATTFQLILTTSSQSYKQVFVRAASSNDQQVQICINAIMGAGDTATLTIIVSGEAGNTDTVLGTGSPYVTYFSGFPIA